MISRSLTMQTPVSRYPHMDKNMTRSPKIRSAPDSSKYSRAAARSSGVTETSSSGATTSLGMK